MHQQIKNELGLDHFEGRSWRGLHHHALLCQIASAFLQHLRLGGKIHGRAPRRRPAARTVFARGEAAPHGAPRAPRPMSRMLPPNCRTISDCEAEAARVTRREIGGCASRGHGDVKFAPPPYPRRAVLGPDGAA